jgi:hypothetical protein
MTVTTLYSDADVSVSTDQIMISGKTYDLPNVKAVKITRSPSAIINFPRGLLIFGLFILLSTFEELRDASDTEMTEHLLVLVFSSSVVALASYWLKKCKAIYHLVILGNACEEAALSSQDKSYIEKIVLNINNALKQFTTAT